MDRVLVAEDEYLIALELAEALQGQGVTLIGPVASVQEGLTLLNENGPLDAAVLDIVLPDGLVYPLANALQDRSIPFIFASVYGSDEVDERFRATPLFTKPFDTDELMKQLDAS
jgi:CheY-like chemotaxis protein